MNSASRRLQLLSLVPLALGLTGCVSLGGAEPPDQFLDLTASARVPAGETGAGTLAEAIVVIDPEAPRRLDVVRVPVQLDDSSVAYLKDAAWVEKPARLFGRLLAESLRAGGKRFVVDTGDLQYAAATRLSGELLDMGYDARSGAAVVRYDALLQLPDGTIRTRRFVARVDGVAAQARAVGAALNQAANQVAADVAEWVG